MNNPKAWKVFLVILSSSLIYGLSAHDKKEIITPEPEPVLADKITIRDIPDNSSLASSEVRREVVLMGSQFVFIVDAPEALALKAITAAANAIKNIELQLTSWRPGSDVARLNENAGNIPVRVGKHTLHLLRLSKAVSQKTAGAFDVTIGAVWDLWPFRMPNNDIPTEQEIKSHLVLVDAASIEINEQEAMAFLPKKGMKINFGAIGKGYAAEIAVETMKEIGVKRAAISAGGDLYLLGRKNSGPWMVSVEHPRWPGKYLAQFFAGDIAVATTGDAKQYLIKDGKRYGHIIDPKSGWPAEDCQSVTIATASASLADAYATAVYVMGFEKGMKWVEQQSGVETLIVDVDGRQHRSSGWQRFTESGRVL